MLDVRPGLLLLSVSAASFFSLQPASVLKDTSSLQICDLQPFLPPAPTSSLVFPSPPLLDEKIGVPGRALWSGEGVGGRPSLPLPLQAELQTLLDLK